MKSEVAGKFRAKPGLSIAGGSFMLVLQRPGPSRLLLFICIASVTAVALSCSYEASLARMPVTPNQEDRAEDGGPYTASTQSFLRGSHWLEEIDQVELRDDNGLGTFVFLDSESGDTLRVTRLPLDTLLPRLCYRARNPPDRFDAFNLMMAEYSRVGQSVPWAEPDDTLAHFEAPHLATEMPYSLRSDYDFVPEPRFRPLRTSVVNNCLQPGQWEFFAVDRAGEIYHSWFELPREVYAKLVSRANGVEPNFAAAALEWSIEPVEVDLDRLRRLLGYAERVSLDVVGDDEPVGYSTQDSRRKLGKGFASVVTPDGEVEPSRRGDLTEKTVSLPSFIPPGKYSKTERRQFDLEFLRHTAGATVRKAEPLTHYNWRRSPGRGDPTGGSYIELRLSLGNGRDLLVGNLPVSLLVPLEDFEIHGFGVGILSADNPAERTRLLVDGGPAPSFAYILEEHDQKEMALNSHELGIEQVFVRARPNAAPPYWEVTVASYERIVDFVRYRVGMPADLVADAQAAAADYVSPVYFTYRDDNTR